MKLAHQNQDPKKNSIFELGMQILVVIGRIHKSFKKLSLLTRDASADKLEKIEFKELILDTLFLSIDKFKSASIPFKATDPPTNVFVLCRSVQISQILLNLISNSYKSTCNNPLDAWVKIDYLKNNQFLEIHIQDSAPRSVDLSMENSLIESNGGQLQQIADDKICHLVFSLKIAP